MIRAFCSNDKGQAFPLYMTAAMGLLFVALAYFAVGQAAVLRNGAQTAADAAALAAAQETRDRLWLDIGDLVGGDDLDGLEDLLDGRGPVTDQGCAEAQRFAAENNADSIGCERQYRPLGYTVRVETRDTVGDTIVPGVEDDKATAEATAVVEPRCSLDLEDPKNGVIECDGEDWTIDPDDLDSLPDAADLFSVRLSD
ncbi:pilus assembly protein TadG-related protein [Streptomyces sp. HB2AG]|uniref:pilus assembly protein TadG-related protein n=1 Tax=Streptomyces sp. HB2AG TaxID=2983400 RepID=UPI002E7C1FE4|nr:pilus assembly protein TadG-related protein [Streptomyces sp. HB2AG]